jgi:hypothetical protein
MKRVILTTVAVSVTAVLSFAVPDQTNASLITFSFTGSSGNEASLAPDAQPDHLSVSDLIRGSGLSAASGAGTFSASGWTTGTALDPNDYFAFSITPEIGWTMTLTDLLLDERRSLTGIHEWSVRSSLDGFASDLESFAVPDNDLTRANQSLLLPGLLFSDLTSAVEFRIYGFGSESASGTWRIDNVRVEGTMTLVSTGDGTAVPETLPGGYAACALLGTLLLGTRRIRELMIS